VEGREEVLVLVLVLVPAPSGAAQQEE